MPGTKRFQHVIETPEPGKWELSGYEAAVPITEKSNPLTQDLDKADAENIVRLLGQCDAEIFQEEGQALPTYQRLYSESILTTMVQVAGKVQEVLKRDCDGSSQRASLASSQRDCDGFSHRNCDGSSQRDCDRFSQRNCVLSSQKDCNGFFPRD
ncbi:glucokinase regulatory protein [Hylobates moloch]|uniref:glucokinase regulatory protein n=1 Tax=Hylobates moloch TaxID=81572 RepID=UPI002675EFA8|nr:glucokinase regulatory protein [Hylobates moloch]